MILEPALKTEHQTIVASAPASVSSTALVLLTLTFSITFPISSLTGSENIALKCFNWLQDSQVYIERPYLNNKYINKSINQ